MSYDTDKTDEVLGQLKDVMREGRARAAMQMLRHADGAGGLRRDESVLGALVDAVGEKRAEQIVKAFAAEPCPYCKVGRERCDECAGKGFFDELKVCKACAGLGLRRCPMCNGTSLAGYDFVPRGLRAAVRRIRVERAWRWIEEQGDTATLAGGSAREIAERIIGVDRSRGMLANAVEHARMAEHDGAVSASELVKIERECRRCNQHAEKALARLMRALAEHYERKAGEARDEEKRVLFAHRVKVFAGLSAGEGLQQSSLRTPRALLES